MKQAAVQNMQSAKVKQLLSPEENKVVHLLANIFVNHVFKTAYEQKKSYQVPADQYRQAKQL